MIKKYLFIIISFTAGFFINYALNFSSSLNKSQSNENLFQAKNDLILISQNEYLEYTKIKDLKQKYEKADELLGKVMVLFLADIGFKAQRISADKLDMVSSDKENVSNVKTDSDAIDSPSFTVAPVSTAVVQEPIIESLKGKSALIHSLKSREQIVEVLDKAVIENPKVAVASGSPVEQKQMKAIEGSFIGEITFFDKKREARNLSWELIPNYRENPIETEFHLRIYGGGKGESVASGRGQLRHVSVLSEDPYAYMVETCGGECYLQMYYNGVRDQFYGNYYELKDANKKFERVGLINLRK